MAWEESDDCCGSFSSFGSSVVEKERDILKKALEKIVAHRSSLTWLESEHKPSALQRIAIEALKEIE